MTVFTLQNFWVGLLFLGIVSLFFIVLIKFSRQIDEVVLPLIGLSVVIFLVILISCNVGQTVLGVFK